MSELFKISASYAFTIPADAGRLSPSKRTAAEKLGALHRSTMLAGIRSAALWCATRVSGWRRRRADTLQIDGLSDHHLRDIGLKRTESANTLDAYLRSGGR